MSSSSARLPSPVLGRCVAALTVAAGVALLVLACRTWAMGVAAPGERTLAPARAWAARAAAGSLFAIAHAAIVGVALPLIYRRRAIYPAAAAVVGMLGALAGVTAAALYAATPLGR